MTFGKKEVFLGGLPLANFFFVFFVVRGVCIGEDEGLMKLFWLLLFYSFLKMRLFFFS